MLAAVALAGCAGHQARARKAGALRARMGPLEVAHASFGGMTFRIDVEFHNTTSVPFTLARIDYKLALGGTPAGEGRMGEGTRLEPGARTVASGSVDVALDDLRKAVPSLAVQPQLGYVVRAVAVVEAEAGSVARLPLRGQGVLEVPCVPRLELASLALEHLDVSAARLKLTVLATNPYAFPATIQRLQCQVALAGKQAGTIDLEPNLSLAPGKAAGLAVPLSLDFRRLGRDLHAAMGTGAIHVRITGTARVATVYGEPGLPFDIARKLAITR